MKGDLLLQGCVVVILTLLARWRFQVGPAWRGFVSLLFAAWFLWLFIRTKAHGDELR